MKALFSSPAPNFKRWMTLCTLGVTLLSVPVTAFAQDAVMPSSRGDSHGSHDSHDSHNSHKKIYVNHTKWMVKYANNGPFHPVPWEFSPDGTVRAGNLWQGEWQKKKNSKDTIKVVIRMNNSSATDEFNVQFTSSSNFTAYKNGQAYRFAVRQ
ncbi:hypothetical protein IQ264_28345 [Phormidium sp. LEGE 05292]|uniref:hypothetical protein n=1 Tax=[Phormidium] sp. LEGE 05292 TaxID=767427 RepID=UPI00187EB6EF|nr:hypothetical protein [Phormidium sp. LEGE 05292]MBE9229320.1 hypothetical protein [Phormidium sp. LEGE 05292]